MATLFSTGNDGEEFKTGWLEGKRRYHTDQTSEFEKGTVERAASDAAFEYHKSLGTKKSSEGYEP